MTGNKINIKYTALTLFLVLCLGCTTTPDYKYKTWIVTATSNGGVVKNYEIRSVNKPIIRYGWRETTVCSYNEKPEPIEPSTVEVLRLPDGWLIEISEKK